MGREKEKVHELQNVCVVVMTAVRECFIVNFQNAKVNSPGPRSKVGCTFKHGNVIKLLKMEKTSTTQHRNTPLNAQSTVQEISTIFSKSV